MGMLSQDFPRAYFPRILIEMLVDLVWVIGSDE